MEINQFTKQYPLKRAFITGAASGLGRALCVALAKDAWLIGISDINEEQLAVTEKLIKTFGGRSLLYNLDVSNRKQYKSVAENFLKEAGGIDLLINNAGIADVGEFDSYSLERWDNTIAINQMGPIHGCYFFIPTLKKQQSGHIINIASAAAFVSRNGMSSYNVTKAAVLSLSETLYYELKGFGVNVSVATPTFFETNIMQFNQSDKDTHHIAQLMLATSGMQAETIAETILSSAAKGVVQIVTPFQAKWLYLLKRFSPRLFRWLMLKVGQDKQKMLNRLNRKKAKMQQK